MGSFRSAREAKEYLIGRIISQAKQDGITLSEIERKMLYFSETGWTLPGMLETNAEFERDYNDAEYEDKIEQLIRNLRASQDEAAERAWLDAVSILSSEDHYLLVLIDAARHESPVPRARGDFRWLILTAAVMVAVLFGLVALTSSLNLSRFWSRGLVAAAFLALAGGLVRFKVMRW
ncbi:MAG TPA: hypothetical protein VMD92_20000 [Acidobacteriaceae bacterium]|nr:hypothetical protein [Acidobacteriaceae bacterium]